MDTLGDRRYDAIAFGAHPDDLEVVMGVTAAKLARAGRAVVFVDLCEGEPDRSRASRADVQAPTVFTTQGSGVHPDRRAVTDIVVHGVFYARLPKWEEIDAGERLRDLEPHEIERLFFGHCRMEPPWSGFDCAVDVTTTYDQKMASGTVYATCQRRVSPFRNRDVTQSESRRSA